MRKLVVLVFLIGYQCYGSIIYQFPSLHDIEEQFGSAHFQNQHVISGFIEVNINPPDINSFSIPVMESDIVQWHIFVEGAFPFQLNSNTHPLLFVQRPELIPTLTANQDELFMRQGDSLGFFRLGEFEEDFILWSTNNTQPTVFFASGKQDDDGFDWRDPNNLRWSHVHDIHGGRAVIGVNPISVAEPKGIVRLLVGVLGLFVCGRLFSRGNGS